MTENAPIVFVDTETTGVHHRRKPWEIAVIRRETDGTETEHVWMLPLYNLTAADPFGLRVGRFYERHPWGRYLSGRDDDPHAGQAGPGWPIDLPERVARELVRLTHGAHWVGAVPNFDAEVIARLLRKYDLLPAWHYHLIDIEGLAVGYLAARGVTVTPPWKSTELYDHLGMEPQDKSAKHTALGDAYYVRAVYDHVMTDQGVIT